MPSIKFNQEVLSLNNLNEIPAKASSEQWTDEQWQAIHSFGSDMLVAAAAGSGKTAVLVQRIIEKIISKDNPIDIDHLLVLTFTNAAAAEMRFRISEALEKELLKNPSSAHLRRQVSLMNKAQISTLHSFCIEIVRSHFYKINLDPKFKIASEQDSALLLEESIEKLLESEYSTTGNAAFLRTVDSFSSDRSDEQFTKMLVDVYRASLSHPNPIQWLNGLVELYQLEDHADIHDLKVYPIIKQDIYFYLHAAIDRLKLAIEICNQGEGLDGLIPTLINDINNIEKILESTDANWQITTEFIKREIFAKAPSIRNNSCDVVVKEKAMSIRKEAKKYIEIVAKTYFERDSKGYISDIREMGSVISTISELVKKLHEIFTTAKLEKNVVDFNDLEHLALKILTITEADQLKPTEIALEYQHYFNEVLVDEYQDTNNVQESIIQAIKRPTEKDGNLFMVGDVKQSIYRFRLADPSLFLKKYKRFEHTPSDSGLVIDLNKNFRSRKEVLDGTNYIFKQIMDETVGEIDYDEAASLYYGANYPKEENEIEIHFLDKRIETSNSQLDENAEVNITESEEEDASAAQFEAKEMATRIKKMMTDGTQVYNAKDKAYRPLQYRDIVILHRSKSWYGEIVEEFKKQGIPVYAELGKGYFETTEMSIMMSLLKIIENPYQDIPLAAVLRSPLVRLSSEQLTEIRLVKVRAPFYEALKDYVKVTSSNNLTGMKVEKFLKRLMKWVQFSKNNPVSSLIWEIYRETNYLDFVLGLPNGLQRQANLYGLYNRASEFEKGSYHGIFRFLRFVERLLEKGEDFGEVSNIGEQEDVVRVMTIHASKGLEFPVVFVGGLSKKFNQMDLNTAYMTDKDYGLAVKFMDTEKRFQRDTLLRGSLVNKKKLELVAEEMRLLYVALTRAKEKLVLFATVDHLERSLQKWSIATTQKEWILSDSGRALCRCYIDWIGPALMRHKSMGDFLENNFADLNINTDYIEEISNHPSKWNIRHTKIQTSSEMSEFEHSTIPSEENLHGVREKVEEGKEDNKIEFIFHMEESPYQSEFKEQVHAQMNWDYGYKNSTRFKAKQSVTEIKKLSIEQDDISSEDLKPKTNFTQLSFPDFNVKKVIGAAEHGTIMHMVMQHIDLSNEITLKSISDKLEELVRREFMTAEQKKTVKTEQILGFYQTTVGKKLLQSNKIWREIPFSLLVKASDIYINWDGQEEKILVQGVIDCMLEDNNGDIILVDYKTDRIKGMFPGSFEEAKPELTKRYHKQIELYVKAIEEITKKKVVQKILYFFDAEQELIL